MDLWLLKPGHKIRTVDGAEAEVLSETEDGEWVQVRYLKVNTVAPVSRDKVEVLLGAVAKRAWGDKVAVIIHQMPETEDFEGGYEAVTMAGVPHNVSVAGSDSDSAVGALNHLLSGLEAFGFAGRVVVEDATRTDSTNRYEVEVG